MVDEPEDKALFEQAYDRYKGKMLSLAYKLTGSYHDAEEAVSSAFFKIAIQIFLPSLNIILFTAMIFEIKSPPAPQGGVFYIAYLAIGG